MATTSPQTPQSVIDVINELEGLKNPLIGTTLKLEVRMIRAAETNNYRLTSADRMSVAHAYSRSCKVQHIGQLVQEWCSEKGYEFLLDDDGLTYIVFVADYALLPTKLMREYLSIGFSPDKAKIYIHVEQ